MRRRGNQSSRVRHVGGRLVDERHLVVDAREDRDGGHDVVCIAPAVAREVA